MAKYEIDAELRDRLERTYTYHAPFGDQPDRYVEIRAAIGNAAAVVCENAPHSRERSLALTKLEEAVMHANAAIARNEKPAEPEPNSGPGPEPAPA